MMIQVLSLCITIKLLLIKKKQLQIPSISSIYWLISLKWGMILILIQRISQIITSLLME